MRWPLHDHLEIYAARVHETKRYVYNTLQFYICVLAKNIPSLLSGNYCFWVAFVADIIRAMNQMCVYPGDGDGDDDGDDDGDVDDDGETSEKQLDEDPQLHEVR